MMSNDLAAQIARLEARANAKKAKLREATRRADTRRKILLGSYILTSHATADGALPEEWVAALDRYLVRDRDRALFGLPARGAAGE
jgi:hypothetical protein